MAYMSQTHKKELAPGIKKVLKKYKMKGSLGVHNHSTLVLNVKSGSLDIIGNFKSEFERDYIQVNEYHIDTHYTGKCKDFLNEIKEAMMKGNHDKTDIMTDYFDRGWYININIGGWNKPYEFVK